MERALALARGRWFESSPVRASFLTADAIAMDEQTDADMVADVLAGQRDVFASLVRKYQAHAYGTAIGILSDFELARDVVQEAFLAAYRDLRKLREPDRFAGWLHGIVRNRARSALRELRRVQELAEEIGRRAEPSDPMPAPERSAEEAEHREIVMEALGSLGEKNREAVSLYYVDGLSYADIAGFLDVTEATVQGRLQRGREELRKELKMVKDTFDREKLPEDFSAEVQRLLAAAAEKGKRRDDAMKRLAEIGAPAVDPLCEALDDPRIAIARAAARALCKIADPASLGPILDRLFTKAFCKRSWQSAILRSGAVFAIPGMRDVLLRIVQEGKRVELWVAIRALGHLRGDREAIETVRDVLRDVESHSEVSRGNALQTLCALAPESAVEYITETLRGRSRKLHRLALWLAVSGGHLPPLDACIEELSANVGWLGRALAGDLVLRHGEEGKRELVRILRTEHGTPRYTAAMALAHTGSPEALAALKEGLLGGHGGRKWLKVVSGPLVKHYGRDLAEWIDAGPDQVVNVPSVVWAMARDPATEAGPMMEGLFRVGSPSARQGALRILAREKGAAFIPELRRCLREGRPRKVAQEAFWQMHKLRDDALPAALEMFESEHWTERKAAASLLRRWGKLTEEQRLAAANDPHVAVRHAAEWHPGCWEAAESGHRTWSRKLKNHTPPD